MFQAKFSLLLLVNCVLKSNDRFGTDRDLPERLEAACGRRPRRPQVCRPLLEVNLLTDFEILNEKVFIDQMQTGTSRIVCEMERCPKPEETSN